MRVLVYFWYSFLRGISRQLVLIIYNKLYLVYSKGGTIIKYNRELKKELCEKIYVKGDSTLKTAYEFDIPIKTLEKWITSYNKDNHCFALIIETITDIKIINKRNTTIDYNNLSFSLSTFT